MKTISIISISFFSALILLSKSASSETNSTVSASPSKTQVVDLQVTDKGFVPNSIDVIPQSAVTLKITRKTDMTCATDIQIPSKKIKMALPLNQTVTIELGLLKKGEIRFGCGMNMMEGGKIFVR